MMAKPDLLSHNGKKTVVSIAAHHSISLPVAETESAFNLRGTLRDVTLARENSAGILGSVAFSVSLGHDTQVAHQGSPAGFVSRDVSDPRNITNR